LTSCATIWRNWESAGRQNNNAAQNTRSRGKFKARRKAK
jgi:hypothetical protein